jgi:hypothetical protein
MTFLTLVDEDYVRNLDELRKFMMSDEVTQEMFDDINQLKKWIDEGTNCLWFIEKYGDGTIKIIQYEWESTFLLREQMIKEQIEKNKQKGVS